MMISYPQLMHIEKLKKKPDVKSDFCFNLTDYLISQAKLHHGHLLLR